MNACVDDESKRGDKWDKLRAELEANVGLVEAAQLRDEIKRFLVDSRNTDAFRGADTSLELWNVLTYATRALADPHSRVGKSVYKFAQAMKHVHRKYEQKHRLSVGMMQDALVLPPRERRARHTEAQALITSWERAVDVVLQFLKSEIASTNGIRGKRRDALLSQYERALEGCAFEDIDAIVMRITVREIRRAHEHQKALAEEMGLDAVLCNYPEECDTESLGSYGYVYLIKEEGELMYKIGMTQNMHKRFKSAQTDNPHVLGIVHVVRCEDERAVEGRLHQMFRAHGGPFCANRNSLGISDRATEWFVFDQPTVDRVVDEMNRMALPEWKRKLVDGAWIDEVLEVARERRAAFAPKEVRIDREPLFAEIKQRIADSQGSWSAVVEQIVSSQMDAVACNRGVGGWTVDPFASHSVGAVWSLRDTAAGL